MPHIIIAEDEDDIRWMLKKIITRTYSTAHVDEAQNGLEALRLYEQKGADLIITDACMPQMSGLDLATTIRARSASTPIIIISGKLPIKQDASVNSYMYIMEKPLHIESFLACIAQMLNSVFVTYSGEQNN